MYYFKEQKNTKAIKSKIYSEMCFVKFCALEFLW